MEDAVTSNNLVERGNKLVEQNKCQLAIACYVDALYADLNNHLAFYHLGVCLAKLDRLKEAMSFFVYVIRVKPDFAEVYISLAEVLVSQQKFDAAIGCYQKAISIEPNRIKFQMSLGKIWKAQGELEKAIACFQRVMTLKPDFLWAYIQAGGIYRQQGNYPLAVECYLKALEINPRFLAAYTILEFIPLADARLDRAIAVYRQIVATEPQIFSAWANLGNALTQKQELDRAIVAYEQASYHKTIAAYPHLASSYPKTSSRSQPDFIIIGAGKCGTTSLYQYLSQHPQVLSPISKEINFFNFNFAAGMDWYLAHFPTLAGRDGFITGEASPSYFSYGDCDRRIAELLPGVKLVVLVRNPVERAISHYYHRVREGVEKRTLAAALNSELSIIQQANPQELAYLRGYLGLGLYVYKLKRWLSLFEPKDILILRSEDLYQDTAAILNQTYEFLNLAENSLSQYSKHNSGSYQKQQNKQIKLQLSEFFKNYNSELESFLDRPFNWNRSLTI